VISTTSWRERVNFQSDDDEIRFVLDQHAELDFNVLAHWNNSPRVNMSPHSGNIILLLNAVCLAEKQQILIM
jgi:hypothetical protein